MRGDEKTKSVWPIFLLAIIVLIAFIVIAPSCLRVTNPEPVTQNQKTASPGRISYAYSWEDEDAQGGYSDEVAAAYILLKASGIEMSKDELISLPATYTAQAISDRLNTIIPVETRSAIPISNQNLLFVPAPALIWFRDGESIRPVVFLYADEAEVTIADPQHGITTYPFSVFSQSYDNANRQAVYIAKRGYTVPYN